MFDEALGLKSLGLGYCKSLLFEDTTKVVCWGLFFDIGAFGVFYICVDVVRARWQIQAQRFLKILLVNGFRDL